MSIAKVCFLLVALVACQQAANAFDIVDCAKDKTKDAKFISLSVDLCPDQTVERCTFVKGQNATMTINFQPTKTFQQANISIKGQLGPLWVPFQFDGPKNACGNYGFECPVKVGDQDTLQFSLPVSRTFPSINTAVRFDVTDENKDSIFCVQFPIQLKSA